MAAISPVRAGDQEHGADAAGGEALGALGEFVVDVGGGDHGGFALGLGRDWRCGRGASAGVARRSLRLRSRALVLWSLAGFGGTMTITRNPRKDGRMRICLPPAFFQDLRGFSSFFRDSDLGRPYITLVSGLTRGRPVMWGTV